MRHARTTDRYIKSGDENIAPKGLRILLPLLSENGMMNKNKECYS